MCKKLNIAIDIDDTIMNTFDYLMPCVAEYFNIHIAYLKEKNISYCNWPEEWKKDEIPFAQKYYDKLIANTPIKPDAVEYLNKIKQLGHSIFIVTARSKQLYTDPYKTTTNQLQKNHVCYDKLICSFDKAKACIEEKIDLFIDDSPHNCIAVKNTGIPVLLFDSKHNQNVTEFQRVCNWKEVYEYIVNFMAR